MKKYEFWFVVGSQLLYGEDVLKTVADRAQEMAEKLSAVLPYPLKYKVTAKSSAEITQVVKEANYDDNCAGIVTWCHTFSPSKMSATRCACIGRWAAAAWPAWTFLSPMRMGRSCSTS